ncbi:MAG: glycogen-binding domain-containing protein [Thermodesulfobacteriota bacterium]|nr:glycogen-binding domain-containing protein [Thermodesulfobacteriota bacterium]
MDFEEYKRNAELLGLPIVEDRTEIIHVKSAETQLISNFFHGESQVGKELVIELYERFSEEEQGKIVFDVIPDHLCLGTFPIWKDCTFHYHGSSDRNVDLVGDFTEWDRRPVVMQRDRNGFRAVLSLEDGTYLYRFHVNGDQRIDPLIHDCLAISEKGLTSVITLQRFVKKVRILNSTGHRIKEKITCSQSWLKIVPAQLEIEEKGVVELQLHIDPSQMTLGENKANMGIITTQNEEVQICLEIKAKTEVHGVMVRPMKHYIKLGKILRIDKVECNVPFEILGQGSVNILFYGEHGTVFQKVSIQGSGEQNWQPVECRLHLDMRKIPKMKRCVFSIYVDTGSYLFNKRAHILSMECDLVYLISSPFVLDFRGMKRGTKHLQYLHVKRSDGEKVNIEILLPESLDGRVTLFRLCEDAWQIEVDSDDFISESSVSEQIILRDSISTLQEHIRFFLEMGH